MKADSMGKSFKCFLLLAAMFFIRYKKGTEHMAKSLVLSDQTPLNKANQISNFIQQ